MAVPSAGDPIVDQAPSTQTTGSAESPEGDPELIVNHENDSEAPAATAADVVSLGRFLNT